MLMAGLAGLMALALLALCWRALLQRADQILLDPGSTFSVPSLAAAAAVAAAVIALRRRKRGRRTGLALLRRALWPRRMLLGASGRADLGFFALNTLVTGFMLGWAILSFPVLDGFVSQALAACFAPPSPALPPVAADFAMTLALFLAYELAYWLDHYTSHQFRFFWEFHRVHHTAETLTPLTVWRVHPVESLKFANIAVLVTAPVNAIGHHVLGSAAGWTVGGSNLFLILLLCLIGHLQHSHVWIAFTGRLGRVLASPAHHQLHHSANPAHFGRNLGSMLAVFDWLFGTLLLPTRDKQPLVFGADGGGEPHTITGALVTPFVQAVNTLRPRRGAGGVAAATQQAGQG